MVVLGNGLVVSRLLVVLFIFALSLFPIRTEAADNGNRGILIVDSCSPVGRRKGRLVTSFVSRVRMSSRTGVFIRCVSYRTSPIFRA